MHEDQQIEAKRQAIITYYTGESLRLEEHAKAIAQLSRQCRTWAESARLLPTAGVEYIFGVVEQTKREQAELWSRQALASAKALAAREQ